jgi:hypothetical protein
MLRCAIAPALPNFEAPVLAAKEMGHNGTNVMYNCVWLDLTEYKKKVNSSATRLVQVSLHFNQKRENGRGLRLVCLSGIQAFVVFFLSGSGSLVGNRENLLAKGDFKSVVSR